MADIDKSLPNVEQTINVPSPEEVEIVEQEKAAEQGKPPVDVQQNDDGSAEITFDPRAVNPGEDNGHFANLADFTTTTPITKHHEKTGNTLIPKA